MSLKSENIIKKIKKKIPAVLSSTTFLYISEWSTILSQVNTWGDADDFLQKYAGNTTDAAYGQQGRFIESKNESDSWN